MLSKQSARTLSGVLILLCAITIQSCHKSVSSPDTSKPLSLPGGSIRSDYNGYLQSLDFSNPASIGQVNSWVARNTPNKITSILDNFAPGEEMLLVNAICQPYASTGGLYPGRPPYFGIFRPSKGEAGNPSWNSASRL